MLQCSRCTCHVNNWAFFQQGACEATKIMRFTAHFNWFHAVTCFFQNINKSSDYDAVQIILCVENPTYFKMKNTINEKMCSHCSKTNVKLRKCSQCMSRLYCSNKCQKKDWKLCHKKVCVATKTKNENKKSIHSTAAYGRIFLKTCLGMFTNFLL